MRTRDLTCRAYYSRYWCYQSSFSTPGGPLYSDWLALRLASSKQAGDVGTAFSIATIDITLAVRTLIERKP